MRWSLLEALWNNNLEKLCVSPFSIGIYCFFCTVTWSEIYCLAKFVVYSYLPTLLSSSLLSLVKGCKNVMLREDVKGIL